MAYAQNISFIMLTLVERLVTYWADLRREDKQETTVLAELREYILCNICRARTPIAGLQFYHFTKRLTNIGSIPFDPGPCA